MQTSAQIPDAYFYYALTLFFITVITFIVGWIISRFIKKLDERDEKLDLILMNMSSKVNALETTSAKHDIRILTLEDKR